MEMSQAEHSQGIDKVLALLDQRGELPRYDVSVETGIGIGETAHFLGELQKDHHVQKIEKKNRRGHSMTYYGLTPKGSARAKFIDIEFPPPPEKLASEFGEPASEPVTKRPAPRKPTPPKAEKANMHVPIPEILKNSSKRARIYEALYLRPQSAEDLTHTLNITPSAASSQLTVMKRRDKLIRYRKPKGIEVSVTGKAYSSNTNIWEVIPQDETIEDEGLEHSGMIRIPKKVRGAKRIKAYEEIYRRAQSSGDLQHVLGISESAASNMAFMLKEIKVVKRRKPTKDEVTVLGKPYPKNAWIYYAIAKGANNSATVESNTRTADGSTRQAVTKRTTKTKTISGDWQSFVDNAAPVELIDMLMAVTARMEVEFNELIKMGQAVAQAQAFMPDFIKNQEQK